MKNTPHADLMGKDGYVYSGVHQYHGSSGNGHFSCDPCSYLLGGMPTAGLTQSCKDTYTGWDDIVGKIFTSVFFGKFF